MSVGVGCDDRPRARHPGAKVTGLWPVVAWIAGPLLLSACVTTAPRVAGGLWTGRLSVRADATTDQSARSQSGSFELSGGAREGQLVLTGPLGATAARARWSPGGIELDTGGGPRPYPSLDAMMQDALGDALPLEAMFDWLAGRPWPGASSQPLPDAARKGFTQLGWTVDLTRFDQDRLLDADRPQPLPALHVRVKLDS